MSPARVVEVNTDEGLRCEVEYYTPLPKIAFTPEARTTLKKLVDEAVVKLYATPVHACRFCTCDARYEIIDPDIQDKETYGYICADCLVEDTRAYAYKAVRQIP
jgi:hypothetical protein